MPVIPPPSAVAIPFDTAETALNFARVILNDCALRLSGNLWADTQPYMQTFTNKAWRRFQNDMAQIGDPAQTQEFLIPAFPVVANTDPYTQVYVNQQYIFDGQNFYTSPNVNLLPPDLICPIRCEERMAGTLSQFDYMEPCDNGVPRGQKTTYLRYWEWRNTGIVMPGATVPRDLLIRYAQYLGDLTTTLDGSVQWYQQPLPILRCADAMSYYIAAECAYSRGSEQAKAVANSFWSDGKDAMRGLMNATTMKIRQRINHRRRPYANGRHRGWNWW